MQDSEIRKLCEEVEEYCSKATPDVKASASDKFWIIGMNNGSARFSQLSPDMKLITHARADLLKLVSLLRARMEEDRWIPCSERLPEQGGEYMVWPGAFVDSHSAQFHDVTKQWTQSGINGVVTHYVTHWRPLPSSPEVQG